MILHAKEKFYRVCIMQIDYALILSAGLGTRMGEIGKILPKVLWPINGVPLLELQIHYCVELGIKKIYINTHFLHEQIENFISSKKWGVEITLLHENPLLDSGGAIHNMAARAEVSYRGNVLLVNADQFLFFEKNMWEEALRELRDSRAALFGIVVDKSAAYNETICENKKLVEIRKNTEKTCDYMTYSGLGILKLDGLLKVAGISRFFETVANFKAEKVYMIELKKSEYWDFGTASIYAENIFKLFEKENDQSSFIDFAKRQNVFSEQSKNFLNREKKSINLDSKGVFREGSIVCGEVVQKI
jgi:mannose-1-phosphate guanylyltransferase